MELTIDQALQKAVEAQKAGQVQEADCLYTAILKAQPKHPDANHNLGVLAVSVGNAQEALPFLKAALEANPSIAQFWLSFIDALIKLDRISEARAVLDKAKSMGAKGDSFDEMEQRLQTAGQLPLEVDKVAKELQPKQPSILDSLKLDQAIKLAKKKVQDGALEEAKRIYQDVLSKFPKNKRAKEGFMGLDRGANVSTSQIQDPPQDHVQSLINLYNQGQLEQAIIHTNTLLKQFPKSIFLLNIQGAILKGLGQLDLSFDAYNQALAIKPEHAETYNNIGVTLKEQGKLEEAIEAYKKALAIKPEYADAFNNMGNALKDQGKLEEAIEAYNKALTIKPEHADAHYNLGNTLKEQGKLEEAIEAYNKALTIRPEHADAHYNLGNTLKEQGKLEEAIDAYNKALAIKPKHPETYNNMGNALIEQGKLEEALEAYNKVLAIKPEHAEASHFLSALTGKTTNSAPRQYIENLFDGYASKFDQSLVVNLSYNIPEVVTQLAVETHGSGSLGSILDLGCGTGLTGEKIRTHSTYLEGIDLSKKMLEIARLKNVYDKLDQCEIIEYLSNAELDFDYFIATDVFIYVGDLSEIFRLIKDRNKKFGKLLFSTEHTNEKGFHLEKSGRYSHSKCYIEELCNEFKFSISHYSETNLRKEKGSFLVGGLYLLKF